MSPISSRLGQTRAKHALRSAGLHYQVHLERASSTNNEIYLSPEHVVRINTDVSLRLKREAQLYPHLPDEPWSPRLVARGGQVGSDFLIVERKRGQPLAHAWPFMSQAGRKHAVAQLGAAMSAIHATPTPESLDRLPTNPQLLDRRTETAVRPVLNALERLSDDLHLDSGVIRAASDYVMDNWKALQGLPEDHLIHGDLTFENILWDGTDMSAIVDFEWSRGAPADLDLDVLLRCCHFPAEHVAPEFRERSRADDYADVPVWLAEAYPGLFAHPQLIERIMMYAISFEVAEMLQIAGQDHLSDHGPTNPYTRLISLVSTGGHVTSMLDRVGLPI